MNERSPKERIYWLMNLLTSNQIEVATFCDEFYKTYEFELTELLTEDEENCFRQISQKTSRFSEFEEDHINYPNVYTTEKEIRNVVLNALSMLIS